MTTPSSVTIAPSILSADFARLAEEVAAVEAGGADWLHVDVMDGHFVPNLTVGPPIVESLRKVTALPLDVHLMMTNPDAFIPDFAQAGADYLTVHVEACPHLHRTIHAIKEHGVKAGVTLNPSTSLNAIEEVVTDVDLMLIMSVNPGFGGQTLYSVCRSTKFVVRDTCLTVPAVRPFLKWTAASTLRTRQRSFAPLRMTEEPAPRCWSRDRQFLLNPIMRRRLPRSGKFPPHPCPLPP